MFNNKPFNKKLYSLHDTLEPQLLELIPTHLLAISILGPCSITEKNLEDLIENSTSQKQTQNGSPVKANQHKNTDKKSLETASPKQDHLKKRKDNPKKPKKEKPPARVLNGNVFVVFNDI